MTFLELVNKKGYSIHGIAIKAGLSYRTLEQYSSGRYSLRNMRASMIVQLAEALEVTPKELIELETK